MSGVIASASDAIKQGKLLSYLEQENKILVERVRFLEIALASEREACAKKAMQRDLPLLDREG